jgi:Uncharacterized protein conserved in bacteria
VEIVTADLLGQEFTLLSAGSFFKFNPSISFHISCKTKEEVDVVWERLIKGGTVLMEIGEYPFSERYGWVQDRYGLSWQVIFTGDREKVQRITPVLMFVGKVYGKTEEAVTHYTSIFKNAAVTTMLKYGKGEEPDIEGTVKYADFTLEGKEFGAMDSAHEHNFAFNEAISFMVHCDTQEEIDHYWEALSAVPESEQCGWLKDAYGVSWQIVPTAMDMMMSEGTSEQIGRVTQAFLKMKKFDIAELQKVYDAD